MANVANTGGGDNNGCLQPTGNTAGESAPFAPLPISQYTRDKANRTRLVCHFAYYNQQMLGNRMKICEKLQMKRN